MRLVRAPRGGRPRGPRDECHDLTRHVGVPHGVRSEAASTASRTIQDFRFIVPAQDVEGRRLRVCPGQDVGCGIVTVLTQLLAYPLCRFRSVAIRAPHLQSRSVQVVGGEIRSEIRAVTVDGTVLHEAVGEERFLAGTDVVPCKHGLPRLRDDARGNRRTLPIDANRQVPQDSKPKNEGEDNALKPPGRNPPAGPQSAA